MKYSINENMFSNHYEPKSILPGYGFTENWYVQTKPEFPEGIFDAEKLVKSLE